MSHIHFAISYFKRRRQSYYILEIAANIENQSHLLAGISEIALQAALEHHVRQAAAGCKAIGFAHFQAQSHPQSIDIADFRNRGRSRVDTA